MTDASLGVDCTRCIGLCCIALSFDRGPAFAFDKPAGVACPELTAAHRCRIHDRLAQSGMAGCAAYDCLGAGQLVTAMFEGLTPASSPAVARAMFHAFAMLREVQAMRRALGPRAIGDLADRLAPSAGWTYAQIATLDLEHLRRLARERLAAVSPAVTARSSPSTH